MIFWPGCRTSLNRRKEISPFTFLLRVNGGELSVRLRGRVWRYKEPLLHKKSRRPRHSQLLYSLRIFNASKSVTGLILERCSSGHSKTTLPGTGKPQSWNFDDAIPVEQPRSSFNISASFPGPSSRPEVPKIKRRRRKWRWPWDNDDVQRDERVIALNDFSGQQNSDFCSNYISTSKYNAASFVPKFLLVSRTPLGKG